MSQSLLPPPLLLPRCLLCRSRVWARLYLCRLNCWRLLVPCLLEALLLHNWRRHRLGYRHIWIRLRPCCMRHINKRRRLRNSSVHLRHNCVRDSCWSRRKTVWRLRPHHGALCWHHVILRSKLLGFQLQRWRSCSLSWSELLHMRRLHEVVGHIASPSLPEHLSLELAQ